MTTKAKPKTPPAPVSKPLSCPPVDNLEALVRALHTPRLGAKIRVLTVLATDPFAASHQHARLVVYVGKGELDDDAQRRIDTGETLEFEEQGNTVALDEEGNHRLQGFSAGDVLAQATAFFRQCVKSKLEVLQSVADLNPPDPGF